MHRIDVPSATPDNQFTEGSPTGGIPATTVSDSWLNDVQEELMSILEAAGVAPVKGVQDQVLTSIRSIISQSGAVIGSVRRGKIHIPTASASATFSAAEVVVGTALGGSTRKLPSVVIGINLATTGAGGMDTGAAPVNGYVAVYAIRNPSTGAVFALGKNATAGVQTDVYSGASMPAGYTESALVAVLATNGSGIFKPITVIDRKHYIGLVQVLNSTVNVSLAPLSIAAAVPPNAVEAFGELGAASTSAANVSVSITSDTGMGQQNVSSSLAAGSNLTGNFANIPLNTPQTVQVSALTTGAGPTFAVYIGGYTI